MSTPHPNRLFWDPGEPNSAFKFGVGDLTCFIYHVSGRAGVRGRLLGKAVSCTKCFDPHLAAQEEALGLEYFLIK